MVDHQRPGVVGRPRHPALSQRTRILRNQSANEAAVKAVLTSVCRMRRLRDQDPTRTIAASLRALIATGKLSPLPDPIVADG